jgi:hypothetical protein
VTDRLAVKHPVGKIQLIESLGKALQHKNSVIVELAFMLLVSSGGLAML